MKGQGARSARVAVCLGTVKKAGRFCPGVGSPRPLAWGGGGGGGGLLPAGGGGGKAPTKLLEVAVDDSPANTR